MKNALGFMHKMKHLKKLSVLIFCCFWSLNVYAQVDAGALIRESQQQAPELPKLPEREAPPKPASDTGKRVVVKAFVVKGSTLYGPEVWQNLLRDMEGQELGFNGMQAAADRVSDYYRQHGYHATAYLPEQSLDNGIVLIQVVEGRFGSISLDLPEGDKRIPVSLVTAMLNKGQETGQVLNVDALEQDTLIANDIPGLSVKSVLTAGKNVGETDVVAQAVATKVLTALAQIDNYDPRSTGANKATVSFGVNNPYGWGDQFAATSQFSEGKKFASGSYSIPLGGSGLRAVATGSYLDYNLLTNVTGQPGSGFAATWSAGLNYPIFRSQLKNLAISANFNNATFANYGASALKISDKVDNNWSIGFNGNYSDFINGGGVTLGGISYYNGDVKDLLWNPNNYGVIPTNGMYSKVTANLARLQRLNESSQFWLSVNGQYASNNLDSVQQMSLGGPYSVRAYPALEGSGDQGYVMNVEYRQDLPFEFKGKVFYDMGTIMINKNNTSPTGTWANPNVYTLKGAGLGLDYSAFNRINLKGMVAWRIGSNPAANPFNGMDYDGTLRQPQWWFLANVDY